jgi:hypothetical protein
MLKGVRDTGFRKQVRVPRCKVSRFEVEDLGFLI